MANKALFSDLIFDEAGNLVQTAVVGQDVFYVIDDAGFLRHIDADYIDRQVLGIFLQQLEENKEIAVEQALRMMGKDDLFTKAAVDAQLNNIDMDQIIAQGVPAQARHMMSMMGFRITVDIHGEVVNMDQPTAADDEF